jgi:multimeric flavodoxin WrbA
LLREALSGAESAGARTEEIVINDLDFSGCQECGGCNVTGECIQDDDMQLLYEKITDTNRIILSSPIFFGSLPGKIKMMIDRCQCLWVGKYILKKPLPDKGKRKGAFICVGGMQRQDFFENAKKLVKIFFAVINVRYVDDLFYPGIDKKGDILEHPTALKEAFELGRRLGTDQQQ